MESGRQWHGGCYENEYVPSYLLRAFVDLDVTRCPRRQRLEGQAEAHDGSSRGERQRSFKTQEEDERKGASTDWSRVYLPILSSLTHALPYPMHKVSLPPRPTHVPVTPLSCLSISPPARADNHDTQQAQLPKRGKHRKSPGVADHGQHYPFSSLTVTSPANLSPINPPQSSHGHTLAALSPVTPLSPSKRASTLSRRCLNTPRSMLGLRLVPTPPRYQC